MKNIDQNYINELVRFKTNEGLDILSITDSNGHIVLRTNNPDLKGDDQSNQDLIHLVLETEAPVKGTVIISEEDLEKESPLLVEQAYFNFIYTPMAIPRVETEETAGMMLMAAVPVFGDKW